MTCKPKVLLDANNIRSLLSALSGESHQIRELQYTRNIPNNPIDALIEEYNNAISTNNLESKPTKCKTKIALENTKYRLNQAHIRERLLMDKVADLEQQRFRNYNNEEYIIFMDDGDDHPESMSAPVVMSAAKFRELFSARARLQTYDEIGR